MNKRSLSLFLVLALVLSVFAGCSTKSDQKQGDVDTTQYMKADELKTAISENKGDYIVFDVRKKADYDTEHIKGAISADVDSIVSNNDNGPAKANIEKALADTDVKGKKIVLLCYSGKRYAAAATELLKGAGIEASNIYTLEGGYKGWTFTDLLEAGNASSPDNNVAKVDAVDVKKVFVTPEWVKSVIDGQQQESSNYIILEASWGTADESPDYKTGHIAGAVHVDIASIEGEPYWNIKTPEEVEKAMLDLGVTKDTTVILYGSDVSGTARVAYAYLWAGVENVKVLDGSLNAWANAGYELETTDNAPKAATEFGTTVPAHPEYWTSIEDAARRLNEDANFRLVSIRSYAEFKGETSGYTYIDKAGEPKGAVWGKAGSDPYHMEDYTHEDGTYITMDEMKKLWEGLDFTLDNHLSFYCGTGWRATIPFLIMYENGYTNMSLYDGGWYQWQMNDELSVQVGDPKTGEVVYTTVKELPNDKAAR